MTATPSLIRELFLHSRSNYTSAEAAEAIGMSLEDVEGWMEVGELEGIEVRGSVVLPWDELVSFAMGFWEQADIEAALGAELAEALPELLMLSDLEVRIPRMESWRWRNWRRGTDNRLTRSSLASCAISCRRNRSGWRQ